MIKYRKHRGGLEESLKTSMEFENIKKLFEYIVEDSELPLSIKKLKIMYYGFDERINQDLFIVSVDDYGVFGFIYYE